MTFPSKSDAPKLAPLKCHNCEAVFGALLPITPATLREALAGTMFAGLAGVIPADVAGTIAPVLTVECGACFLRRIEDAKKDQHDARDEDAGAEVHEDSDEEGNRRLSAAPGKRGRIFNRKRER